MSMLSTRAVRDLLQPFSGELSDDHLAQVITYTELMMLWNKKICLTAIQSPEECITRHFGESFFLINTIKPSGRLLDVGSGAGFPGMALKLLCGGLVVWLLEPSGKKRAFLKEVARACQLGPVEVVGKRLEQFAGQAGNRPFDFVTIRAVGNLAKVLPHAVMCVASGGHICLWIGSKQVVEVRQYNLPMEWGRATLIPLSRNRQILVGRKK
jgi:16S rRNA (guanine527-N7)-methyltransferase